MIAMSWKNWIAVAALVTLGALLGAGMVTTLRASDGETIHGCVNPAGRIRIVNDPSECKSQETSLDWNIAGETGPAGPPGPTGPAGVSGYEIVQDSVDLNPATVSQWDATCPSGKRVLGGGVSASVSSAVVFGSKPQGDTAWRGEVYNPTDAGMMTVFAICAVVQ